MLSSLLRCQTANTFEDIRSVYLAIVVQALQTDANGPNTLVAVGHFEVVWVVSEDCVRFTHHSGNAVYIAVHFSHQAVHFNQVCVAKCSYRIVITFLYDIKS